MPSRGGKPKIVARCASYKTILPPPLDFFFLRTWSHEMSYTKFGVGRSFFKIDGGAVCGGGEGL